ncbi:MAG: acetate--CoA ligase family protein [Candidatus Hodarchaeota archaeon]
MGVDLTVDKSELEGFFSPRAVVIAGASNNEKSLAYQAVLRLISGFKGNVYPVNPRYREVLGLKCYPDVLEVPDDADLCVIIVPAKIVPDIVDSCGKKGIKNVVVVSAGFAEIGGEGVKLQEKVVEMARKYNVRVLGPNCLGTINPRNGLDYMFLPVEKMPRPTPGYVGHITQSGAFGTTFIDIAAKQGLGLSKFVAIGNVADLDEVDFLKYFGDDEETKVVLLYLERSYRKFFDVAKKVSRSTPIVLLKAGRTKAGAAAAASHTASIAHEGADRILDAACEQVGIIRGYDWEEALDYTKIFSYCDGLPEGNRVAIVTDGGGAGVMASDAVELFDLEMSKFEKDTEKVLEEKFPVHYGKINPIDLTGNATTEDFITALDIVSQDKNVDSIVFIPLPGVPNMNINDLVDQIEPVIKRCEKPISACTMGGSEADELSELLENIGIPSFPTPERAVKAISALTKYSKYLKKKSA